MVRLGVGLIVLLVIVDTASPIVNNTQIEARNELQDRETRRKAKKKKDKHISTSSSRAAQDSSDDGTSLDLTSISTSDSSRKPSKKKQHELPESTVERKGWRKWHRKCTRCPEDMRKKWRDPSILWICGAYQRARRSFKSMCMMHYRNCEDGTMFVKIHEHRCANSSNTSNHGDHFFYEYRAMLSIDTSNSGSDSDTAYSVLSSD